MLSCEVYASMKIRSTEDLQSLRCSKCYNKNTGRVLLISDSKLAEEKRKERRNMDNSDNCGKFALLPLKPCRRTGCPELVRGGGFCEKHQQSARRVRRTVQEERGISEEWHGLYYTKRWRELRAKQLIVEPYCRECAKHHERTKATDVDHVIPHRGDRTRFYDPANLQSLCHSCHSRKTIAEQAAATSPPV